VEAEFFCDTGRDIQIASFNKWPPVIDADDGRASRAEIRDACLAREGEGFMGGGLRPSILAFPQRGFSGEENKGTFIVVGGESLLDVANGLARGHGRIGNPPDGVGLELVALIRIPTGDKEKGAGNGEEWTEDFSREFHFEEERPGCPPAVGTPTRRMPFRRERGEPLIVKGGAGKVQARGRM